MQLDGEEEETAAICKEAVGLSFPCMEMMVLKGGPALKEDNSAAAAAAAEVVKVSTAILNERSSMEPSSRLSPSNPKDSSVALNQEEQLEHTKSEMGEVREENERLKMILSQIVKDYHFLQKKYHDFLHQDHHQTSGNPYNIGIASGDDAENNNNDLVEEEEEPEELVSLTLGTSSSSSSLGQKKPEEINTTIIKRGISEKERGGGGGGGGGGGDDDDDISLGLDLKLEGFRKNPNNNETVSPENSSEEAKELDEPGEPWPPSKILKSLSTGGDEASEQPQVKKARVSVRARCDAPTMNDGCQWRKYGQKIAKGNPCPRAYYRCTVAAGCPVRKQVQRCAEDMSILITTYEGTHNHPLPVSATAMASTTAAAASMLMSGSSSSSSSPPQPPVGLLSAANATLNGLHFGLFGAGAGGGSSSRPRQPFLPIPSISSTPSFPTITLDLTSPPPSTSSQFSRSFPRYSSTSFNFSSPSETAGAPSPATSTWGSGFLTYGYGKSSGVGSLSLGGGRPSQDLYPYILQKAAASPSAAARTTPLTDTIAKAITADPGFQSAVAAAITSYVGGAGNGVQSHVSNLKPQGEPFSAASTGVSGCGSSYLNRSTGSSGSSHQASRLFLQPSLALPGSKSGSADQNAESIN